MRSLKEVVWSLAGVSAVGLAMLACGGSDTGSAEPASEPAPSGDVRPDMKSVGCGGPGCPCSPTDPCTAPDTFCSTTGVCEEISPCGNCRGGASSGGGGTNL